MVARSEQPDEEEREGDTQNEHDIGDKARVFEEQARRGHARWRLLFGRRPRLEAGLLLISSTKCNTLVHAPRVSVS